MTDRLAEISRILERQKVEVVTIGDPDFPADQETDCRILGIDTTARAIMALDGWRDIASAPKDGTMIEVIDAEAPRRRFIAGWENDGWRAPGAGHVLYMTHWRPLCAPPAPEPQP